MPMEAPHRMAAPQRESQVRPVSRLWCEKIEEDRMSRVTLWLKEAADGRRLENGPSYTTWGFKKAPAVWGKGHTDPKHGRR